MRRLSASRSRASLVLAAALAVSGGWLIVAPTTQAAPSDNSVLILASTVSAGASSDEAVYAASLGFSVDIVDAATWSGMSAAEFGSYRAIILGDFPCGYPTASDYVGAAESNASTWGPAVDGNVIIIGTDPEEHGKPLVTHNAIDLVTADPGKTGAYVSLSCYYHGTGAGTPVPVLDGLSTFGTFTVTGVPGCFDSVHVVADHPALAGMDDAYLSNWGCSVHEGMDSWPSDFIVLAIATTGGSYTASDGTVGTPYIMARGESITVVSDIGIAAPSAAAVGSSVDYVGTAASGGSPVVGATVTFVALSGSAHAGVLGTAVTDASGIATFSYQGLSAGTDLVTASFVDSAAATQTSGTHSITWSAAVTAAPTVSTTSTLSTTPPSAAPTAGPTSAATAAPPTAGPPTAAPPTSAPTARSTSAPNPAPTAGTTMPPQTTPAAPANEVANAVAVTITPPPTDTDLARPATASPASIIGLAMLMLAAALVLGRGIETRATRLRTRR